VTAPVDRVRLELSPRLDEIARLSRTIELFGQRNGFPETALYETVLVLDELVTNIVSHGIGSDETAPITVELSYAAGTLSVTLSDPGRPFDPCSAPVPDTDAALEHRKIGGLGVHLARTLMDSLSYRYDGKRNHTMLVKRIKEHG
jgi:serine/threonine-protein kinase RsbW